MSFRNLSWLFIGFGIGIMIDEDELFKFIFGILLLLSGFLINYIDDRNSKKKFALSQSSEVKKE